MLQEKKIVFIVNDDDAVRDSLSLVLQAAGYTTHGYASGPDFLTEIDGNGKGCVLLDTLMPRQSGLEVLRHLRVVRPDLPVIMIAGGNGTATAEEAIGAGATGYLTKPFLEDALYERIEKAFLLTEMEDGNCPSADDADYAHWMLARLTATERKIFDILVMGRSDAMIASSLGLGTLDVINHRDAIMEKMEARSMVQLMRIAFMCGIAIRVEADTDGFLRSA